MQKKLAEYAIEPSWNFNEEQVYKTWLAGFNHVHEKLGFETLMCSGMLFKNFTAQIAADDNSE